MRDLRTERAIAMSTNALSVALGIVGIALALHLDYYLGLPFALAALGVGLYWLAKLLP